MTTAVFKNLSKETSVPSGLLWIKWKSTWTQVLHVWLRHSPFYFTPVWSGGVITQGHRASHAKLWSFYIHCVLPLSLLLIHLDQAVSMEYALCLQYTDDYLKWIVGWNILL
jgi:hypothetical protein